MCKSGLAHFQSLPAIYVVDVEVISVVVISHKVLLSEMKPNSTRTIVIAARGRFIQMRALFAISSLLCSTPCDGVLVHLISLFSRHREVLEKLTELVPR